MTLISSTQYGILFFGILIGTMMESGCGRSEREWDDQTLKQLSQSPVELDSQLTQGSIEENDLLLLTLAVRNPQQAPLFCEKVQSTAAREKCRQVIGRPHLQLSTPQTNDVQHNDTTNTTIPKNPMVKP